MIGELGDCLCKTAHQVANKLTASGLKQKAQEILAILANAPYQNPPPHEKLVGDLAGAYSRRINIQHRVVYEVFAKEKPSVRYECGRTMKRGVAIFE